MVFDIYRLKHIRKSLDMTQNQLAKHCSVSQSLIAKIEQGDLDPSYSTVKKIEDAVQLLSRKGEPTAADIMTPKVLSVAKSTLVKDIIDAFRKHTISQMPVIERGIVLGTVTEASILELGASNLQMKTAEEVMIEPPPVVQKKTVMSVVASILRQFPLVVVMDKEKLVGVVTKADLLRAWTLRVPDRNL